MARFLLDTIHDATDNGDLINQDPDDIIANNTASDVYITDTHIIPVGNEEVKRGPVDKKEVQRMFQTDMEAIKAGRNSTLARHNAKRDLHRGTAPMQLNQRASDKAQDWAEKIARGEAFGFDPDNTVCGENVILLYTNNDLEFMTMNNFQETGKICVDRWYEQINNYDFDNHAARQAGKPIGSFTQAVWKNSTYLGVGIAKEKDGKYIIVVCRYFQKGNIKGKRARNIGRLKN
ncbi:Oidioi.mRNA.OKI2018_I69.chr1.g1630.t1.cds [Oikopleura dioica]|uniref:Oidioi.mRNA.OKI2018_I69.chr1.g1630.t1.cds n=1 Tax=Oikopleura dioica TaxID=34765 RepID=A0ABN7SNI7_OIKDI|nr:Oidioi.mRNA.OKI2018_I69.chr1.g1630.t1.cds [Oikopleura dioica]